MQKIKTHETIKDIKTLDRAATLSQRMKDGVSKTKESTEQIGQDNKHENATDYARGHVSDGSKAVALRAKGMAKRPLRQVKHRKNEMRQAVQETKKAYRDLRGNSSAKHTSKTGEEKAGNAQAKTNEAIKKQVQTKVNVSPHATGRHVQKSIKTTQAVGRTGIKTANTAGKTVKTSAGTTKIATKAGTLGAEGANKTAAVSFKMAKLMYMKTKAVAVKVRLLAKAVLATVKLAIAAMRTMLTVLIAGGWVAVFIIILTGVFAAFIASPLGIFFAGTHTEDGQNIQEVVTELSNGFFAGTHEIAIRVPHDELRLGGMTLRWNEILAVYAVRVATDDTNGMEVVTLDEERIMLIRQTLWDMVSLVYAIHAEYREQTATNEVGEEIIEMVRVQILTIQIHHRTTAEMADYYNFTAYQREVLEELLSPELIELWVALLGGAVAGDGRVLVGNENFIPLGIFAWPFEGNWPITSRFGPRPSPGGIGSRNHLGIDIGAPMGTAILASADGVVTTVSYNRGGWGFFIILDHGSGYETLYAHNSRNLVSVGQAVVQGQVIAEVGSTGASTGPHLHFEVIRNGVRVDPLGYFTW